MRRELSKRDADGLTEQFRRLARTAVRFPDECVRIPDERVRRPATGPLETTSKRGHASR